jgi:hypothetical protein
MKTLHALTVPKERAPASEAKEPEKRRSTGGNSGAHKDAVRGSASRIFKNIFGQTDVEWTDESDDISKILTLYGALNCGVSTRTSPIQTC